jgi:predicted transcriptional regulator
MVVNTRPVPTSVRLDPDVKSALERAAAADGRSLSNLMDRIFREWLAAKDKPSTLGMLEFAREEAKNRA